MAEYIEREALKAKFMEHYSSEYAAALVLALIDNQPTVDVAEVRHGKWVLEVKKGSCYDYHVTAHCSKCGWEWIGKDSECVGNNKYVFSAFIQGNKEIAEQFVLDNARQRHLYDYCPYCGAKMDLLWRKNGFGGRRMTEEELLEWLYADIDEIVDMVGDDEE